MKVTEFFSSPGRKKFRMIALIVLLSCLLIFFGVRYYLELREKTRNPWEFLPENTLSVIQVNNVQEFVINLTSNQLFSDFTNILHSSEIQEQFLFYDSVLATKEVIQEAWFEGSLLISTNYMGSEKFETIFIKPLPHPNYKSRVYQFFENHAYEFSEVSIPGQRDKAMKYTLGGKQVFLCIKDGICLFSRSEGIIQGSLKASETKKSNLNSDQAFQKVKDTSGKTAMANLYINHRFIFRYVSRFLNGETLKTLDFLNHFSGWSAYDIHTGEQKITMTGYTSSAGTDNAWLDVFSSSKPQKIEITDYLPLNTLSFTWFGFDNYESFRETYKDYLTGTDEVQDFNNNLTNLKRRTGVQNINELIIPYIDNQMAVFTIPDKTGKNLNSLAIFKTKDTPEFRKNLQDIARSAAKTTKNHPDTSSFRNIVITTIHADYLLFDLFGKMFSSVEKTCYVLHNNFWIVGSSHEILKEYLNQVMSGRIITKNTSYEQFSQSVSGEANIYVYAAPRKIRNNIKLWFNEEHTDKVVSNLTEFDGFEAFGLQFSTQNNMFLSGITLFRSSDITEESSTGWEITLDGQITSGPWFVDVGGQGNKNIIVFDSFNNMYFISDKGEILWKIPVSERPLGKIYTVDAFKNGKFQYLFNSENNIFLVDRNGKTVDGYPVKLPMQAAGSVSVFDYDKSREYRLVFAGTDNIVYNFNIKGDPTSGWEKPNLKTSSSQTVKHIRLINSDALIIRDNENKLHFFSRKGLPMFQLNELTVSEYSEVYAAPKLCRCYVTTTTDGQIAMIGNNGEVNFKIIHEAGSGHVFIYEDMNNDGKSDFIFIEKGKAYIFDENGTLISAPEIGNDAGRKAGYIKDSPYGALLYIFSSDGSEMYLLNKTGRILPDETFNSSNQVDFLLSNDGGKLFITTAKEKNLFYYVIE